MLPVDTPRVTIISTGSAKPYLNTETGIQKVDKNGSPLDEISTILVANGVGDPAHIRSVAIDPKIKAGQELSVRDLMVGHWKNNKGSGLYFNAASVSPKSPSAA